MLPPAPATDVMSLLELVLMSIRLRKFIGTVLLFALVIVWALLAMALAQAPLIHNNAIASIAYYVIAGLGWVLPAMPIMAWMSKRTDNA